MLKTKSVIDSEKENPGFAPVCGPHKNLCNEPGKCPLFLKI